MIRKKILVPIVATSLIIATAGTATIIATTKVNDVKDESVSKIITLENPISKVYIGEPRVYKIHSGITPNMNISYFDNDGEFKSEELFEIVVIDNELFKIDGIKEGTGAILIKNNSGQSLVFEINVEIKKR
ncbi:hypothetical protein STIUS_v1c05280 [Spiroplasma sp. TIUS-1]|uniref:hypothetical protein n=1 Tax=Spiroplasma sp. TIUS-1 TaxID=216963 RepID=UPI001397885A|nr:hypothetical protein [Spiroplasma sp. TIUS-1]QHX36082.1 hypothetical protein STIUS_v1c05280 [Spiroplasma sp. TIUS-1]